MPGIDEQELFREVQPLYQNMVIRVVIPLSTIGSVGVIVFLAITASVQQWEYLLLMLLAIGVIVPWWIFNIKLTTVVTDKRLLVKFSCFPGREIDLTKITRVEALRYNPIADGGGWGWRISRKYHRIYNISGNLGVHVRYGEGRQDQILIGSLRHKELAEAIELARFGATAEKTAKTAVPSA